MAVSFVFVLVAVNKLAACPDVSVVNVKDFLQKTDCYVPVFKFFRSHSLVFCVKLLKENRRFVLAKSFCNLSLYKLEEVHFLRNKLDKLCPELLYGVYVLYVCISQDCLFIIINRSFFVGFLKVLAKGFCKVGFLKIKLDYFFVEIPYLILVFGAVCLCQRSKRKNIVSVLVNDCLSDVFNNIFLVVFLEDVDKFAQ